MNLGFTLPRPTQAEPLPASPLDQFEINGQAFSTWGVRVRVSPRQTCRTTRPAPARRIWTTKQARSGATTIQTVIVPHGRPLQDRTAWLTAWRSAARQTQTSFALAYLFFTKVWGHVSPSQIQTWRKCKRKWAYSRFRPRTSNKYAEFGTKVHSYREDWLSHGKPPDAGTDEGTCALAGLELLPLPGQACVEVPLRLEHEGVVYVGFIDVLAWRGGAHVQDHKSCGSFRYALTAEDLFDDPQRIIYSHWAAVSLKAPYVWATWHYLQRKPPKCMPVSMGEEAPAIAARFQSLHQSAGLPISRAGGIPPEHFERSLDHCGAYGGCPYKDECLAGVSPIQRAAAALTRHQEKARPMTAPAPDLNAMLQANAANTGIPAMPAAPAPAPAAPAPAPAPAVDAKVLRIIAQPPEGTDPEALAAHFGITVADAVQAVAEMDKPKDTRTDEQKAPRKRKKRSDAGQKRGPRGATPKAKPAEPAAAPTAEVVAAGPAAADTTEDAKPAEAVAAEPAQPEPAASTPADSPTLRALDERVELVLACARGGLPPDEAGGYLQLLNSL